MRKHDGSADFVYYLVLVYANTDSELQLSIKDNDTDEPSYVNK